MNDFGYPICEFGNMWEICYYVEVDTYVRNCAKVREFCIYVCTFAHVGFVGPSLQILGTLYKLWCDQF